MKIMNFLKNSVRTIEKLLLRLLIGLGLDFLVSPIDKFSLNIRCTGKFIKSFAFINKHQLFAD